MMDARRIAFGWIILAYLVAWLVAIVVARWLLLDGAGEIRAVFVADVAATTAIWIFSSIFRNSSFYDAYWHVAPIPILLFWAAASPGDADGLRQTAVLTLVLLWALRLTYNWSVGWGGLHHEDWRYVDLRKKSGPLFPFVDYLGIHMMPTLQVFLGCLPTWASCYAAGGAFGLLDIAACIVTFAAIACEAIADEQLRIFNRSKKAGDIMKSGLWQYSRHPNYFGQIMFWWGLYLFALAADLSYWWTGVGALCITLLMTLISVPLIDKRSKERRPGYEEHMRHVPAVFPFTKAARS